MGNDFKLSDIESFKRLREKQEEMQALLELWPALKQELILMGEHKRVLEMEAQISLISDQEAQLERMTHILDRYNDLFADIGWIMFDSMKFDVAEEAVEVAEKIGLEEADEYLTDYFSPTWVENHLILLKSTKGFMPRWTLAEKALEDYREGRFYASVLVVLTMIDGWIGELNIVDNNRQGFFANETELVAWNSIAAHPKGLVKLKQVFGQSRQKTRTETITIPYRHGIVHGMDLGYDNKFVAAKCWAALFAVRDWAIKAARNELQEPKSEPKVAKTLEQSRKDALRSLGELEELRTWQPRQNKAGTTFDPHGEPESFGENTPERKVIEFLEYWKMGNFGYMANCISSMLPLTPADIRQQFEDTKLLDYELVDINDVLPTTASVFVQVTIDDGSGAKKVDYEYRVICTYPDGKVAHVLRKDTTWGITNWVRQS